MDRVESDQFEQNPTPCYHSRGWQNQIFQNNILYNEILLINLYKLDKLYIVSAYCINYNLT